MEAIAGRQLAPARPLAHFTDVVRSEFTKLRSVRSTYWTLFAAILFVIGLAVIGALVVSGNYAHFGAREKADFNPTRLSLVGVNLAQIAIGVLGVLVITSEYATGMIRATLGAVPQRRLVLAAKALVFALTALVVGTVASFIAYFIGQAILSGQHLQSSIGDPQVLRAVFGGGLYLAVLGLLGLGLGAIIRVSAGAISALFGILFVLPIISTVALPQSWQDTINPYLPGDAGRQIFAVTHDATSLGPWAGFGVFCIYAVIALAVAAVLINRRDA
ncbi:MAG: type transport system permease protein [Solirubrobacteraceae bacterium]|jgi:ABC-type transport system involved in multi-copper enzyme maturation permease subunit|nr:type transport system permease protein [Solirubrobacteraceae bacterium]